MDEVHEVLGRDALEALAARICSAASLSAVAEARLIRWIGEFDAGGGASVMESGWGGTAGWLQFACSMSPLVAREHVRIARALRTMPTVAGLFEAGRLSYSKVRAATRLVGELDEAHLAQLAVTLTAAELEIALSTYRRASGHRLSQQSKRSVTWRTDADGFVRVSACLPAEEGALVVAAIEAARDRQPADSKSSPDAVLDIARTFLDTSPGDVSGADRTSVVVMVDVAQLVVGAALLPILTHAESALDERPLELDVSAETPPPRAVDLELPLPAAAPTLPNLRFGSGGRETGSWGQPSESSRRSAPQSSHVREDPAALGHVSAETPASAPSPSPVLRAAAERALRSGACHVTGHGGVEPATAARLACDARALVGVIIDADGDVLHHGRTRRLVSPKQRRAVLVRDRGMCQYPGCHQRRYLDAHHVVHWIVGGATDVENLVLLCSTHHTFVHEGGVAISSEPAAGRRWVFRLPDGSRVDHQPRAFTTEEHAEILAWHARHTAISDRWHPDARRLVPKTGGTPFSLKHAVDALFLMREEVLAA